jgi:hypothetical protein
MWQRVATVDFEVGPLSSDDLSKTVEPSGIYGFRRRNSKPEPSK